MRSHAALRIDLNRAAERLQASARATIPIPRPDNSVTTVLELRPAGTQKFSRTSRNRGGSCPARQLFLQALPVHARAIILHGDHKAITFDRRGYLYGGLLRFATPQALFLSLDAMIDGIAQNVDEGRPKRSKAFAVETQIVG